VKRCSSQKDQAGNAKIELERLTNYYMGYSYRDLAILLFTTQDIYSPSTVFQLFPNA